MARSAAVPANVTLVSLPAYSPELNPVERVWLYLKERFLSHRLLETTTPSLTLPATPTNPGEAKRSSTGRGQV